MKTVYTSPGFKININIKPIGKTVSALIGKKLSNTVCYSIKSYIPKLLSHLISNYILSHPASVNKEHTHDIAQPASAQTHMP